MVLSRVIRTVCPSEDELAMYINTICCKNGYQLEKDILDTLITSNIRQSLNRVQFLCSTSPLNPTQDHSVSITCKRQEKVIEETLEEISRKLCQYSDFEILTMDSQEPEHNSDELMLHAPLIQKPNQELQTFYNFNLSHYLPTHKPIDIVNQYTARNEIYDAISIDYFHLLAYRARDTELLPYLCTIAHLDQPRYLSHDIQLSSRRLTRNSTTK
ncbi:hypothetical protein BC833DRAFT_421481 [Globomyces pollinis-pini]|nr:hypothetical protein BC833DRAFT_421481 [Globomyces pollinis-pini]